MGTMHQREQAGAEKRRGKSGISVFPLSGLTIIASLPEAATAPAEFQVFPYGLVEIEGEEPFVVDEPAMAEAVRRFRERGPDMVVDYEHQTEMDTEAPAAGWITDLIDRGREGLWAVVEWTQRAARYLANREYRYYSPVFLISPESRRLVELLRVALTNAPRLNTIRPIVTKDEDADVTGAPPHLTQESTDMELLTGIAAKLGLDGTATEARVLEALDARLAGGPDGTIPAEMLDALGLPGSAGKSEAIATIHALKQKPDLAQEVAALKEKLALRDRDELIAAALESGKITPAQREWAEDYALRDPEGFRLFIAKAPQVVPVDNLHPRAPGNSPEPGIDDAVLQVAKMFGNSPEDIRKHGLV